MALVFWAIMRHSLGGPHLSKMTGVVVQPPGAEVSLRRSSPSLKPLQRIIAPSVPSIYGGTLGLGTNMRNLGIVALCAVLRLCSRAENGMEIEIAPILEIVDDQGPGRLAAHGDLVTFLQMLQTRG